jgi:ABC-2 type transport system permease protein
MYAVVGILCAGGLGFSSRVPNAQSVQNVTVTYHGLPLYLEFGTGSNDGGLAGSMDAQQTVTLTDPGDIASVLKIHRDFVQAGKLTGLTENMPPQGGVLGTVTTLSYVMKDGSVTIRSFTGATRAMIQNMLNLDSTAGVKKAYEDAILSPTNIFSGAQPYSQGNIFLWTPFYGESEPVGLDAEKRAELLQCIAADLSAQTVQDRYFPAEPETCLLVFQQEGESDAPDDPYERRLVYVTPGFTRTLSFLQANHFLDLLQQKKEIEYLGVVNFDKTQGGTISYGANNICLSFPNFINGTIRGTSDPYRNSGLEMPVTDPAQRQDILSHSHGLYNPIDGGYLVVIRYKGEDRFASAFLPMRDAPYFVKNGAK